MSVAFNNILIPVDFSVNTELAIRKAIEFSGGKNVIIHLFHVEGYLSTIEAKWKLNLLKSAIEEGSPTVGVFIHVGSGTSVPIGIIGISRLLAPDLITIGKHGNGKHFPFFNIISPRRLAEKTNIPVLTVKPGSMNTSIKTIVIPIREFVSERKLEIAVMIAQRDGASVHLVTTPAAISSKVFVNTYQRLRTVLRREIECHTEREHGLVKATVKYAESIMADLLLVDSVFESTVFSLTGSTHISHLLKEDSKIQILDVGVSPM